MSSLELKPTPNPHHTLWNARSAICNEWLNDAKIVAEKVGLPLVQEIKQYLFNFFEPSVPTEKGLFARILEEHKPNRFFYFTPLTKEDCSITLPGIEYEIKSSSKSLARYFDKDGTNPGRLYVNTTWAATPIWRGILLLHEAHHAILDSRRDSTLNEIQHAEEEIQVMDLEAAIVLKLCGLDYNREILKEVEWVLGQTKISADKRAYTIQQARYPQIFDDIFGESLSEQERILRESLFRFQVQRVVFNMLFKEQADKDFLQYRLQNPVDSYLPLKS